MKTVTGSLLAILSFTACCVQAQLPPSAGACADGATLSKQAGDKNRAFDLRANPKFKTAHAQLVKREATWLSSLDGPSEMNRIYQKAGSPPVTVFWSCAQRNCGAESVYGAIEGDYQRYGLVVITNGQEKMLGELSPNAQAAIACAARFDNAIVKSVSSVFDQRK
jgi:hypothetical protein